MARRPDVMAWVTALFPALAKLDELASRATPAERARIFEPAAAVVP